jgi:L-fuculose-phosphate aldolase
MHRDEASIRAEILEAGRRLKDRFFVAANDGNISARLSPGEIIITPTSVNKGDMTADMLLTVDPDGRVLSGSLKPSSEMKMHLGVFRRRPDVQAIVHAHPPVATGFATCRIRLDQDVILPEVIFGLGKIGFAEYGTPTTTEVPDAVEREIADSDAVLLANHGGLTVGESVMQAYYRMEVLEMYSRVRLVTTLLGGAKALNEPQVAELYNVRERQGWGRSRGGPVAPETVEMITQIVLEALQGQGVHL